MNPIYIPATKPEDWKQFLAEPKHWKKGYSAMSLAMCWQKANGFPEAVNTAFKHSDISLFNSVDLLLAIPEYQVPLPGGSAASQNDIFVLAKGGGGQLISITVEGKVSEPFGDKSVYEWYKDPSPGKKTRLKFLCCELDVEPDDITNVRYQLLHRTASAIIEAKRFNAPNALMMVHSFSQANEWFNEFAAFAKVFGIYPQINTIHSAGKRHGINLFMGWVKGDEKYLTMEPTSPSDEGIVTARKCDSCGHHEIGVTNEAGDFVQLKPGMKVAIVD